MNRLKYWYLIAIGLSASLAVSLTGQAFAKLLGAG
jgi:hypothetical protein